MIYDEIKEQTDKFHDMDLKHKFQYIWDYYKWHLLIAFFVIFTLATFIHDRITDKENVLYVAMLNSDISALDDSPILSDFSQALEDFDPSKQELILDASVNINGTDQIAYNNMQKLLAQYNIGSIDATIAPKPTIVKYAEFQAFADLSEALPEDLYKEIVDSGREIVYIDYEDPATGELHADIPVAVNISDSAPIKDGFTDASGTHYDYYDTDCYLGISPNTSYPDNCVAFLRYLLDRCK